MAIAFGTVVTTTLVPMECGECGCVFGISEAKYSRCKDLGEGWYCPNGHSRVFTRPRNSELKQEIEQLKQSNAYLRSAKESLHNKVTQLNHSVRAQKAAKTKIMNRVKNGVCPCCNRTFKDLQNHFKTKHPELLQK